MYSAIFWRFFALRLESFLSPSINAVTTLLSGAGAQNRMSLRVLMLEDEDVEEAAASSSIFVLSLDFDKEEAKSRILRTVPRRRSLAKVRAMSLRL